MADDAQAVRRIGPAPAANAAAVNRAFRTPANAGGTASWTIPGTGPQFPGCWVTISNIGAAATDVLAISFQRSSETLVIAATATDYTMTAGSTQDFWCDQGVDTVRFGGPATAIASHYRSSL